MVTGHQPELFHPGVWIKNFAAAGIAAAHDGVALNLIVDNDLPKSASIRVPRVDAGSSARPRSISTGGAARFRMKTCTFRRRAFSPHSPTACARSWAMPFLPVLEILAAGRSAAGRHESGSGSASRSPGASSRVRGALSNLEVPLSSVCQTDGFSWFACHLLAQLPRYAQIHNQCLAEYRLAHGIRSKHHPVAALARQGEWLEAPFWVWRPGQPQTPRLYWRGSAAAKSTSGSPVKTSFLLELPLAPDREACCAVERLRDLAGQSVRLRTRALTTTLFSRFLLGDLFIHGIGGSKYDELGDEIARASSGSSLPASSPFH